MKYKGKTVEGKNVEVLVLLKGEDQIVFQAESVPSYEEFEKLVAEPTPPTRMRPGGATEEFREDPTFQTLLKEYAEKKTNFLIITSLRVTEELEWDTVNFDKPDTWGNWRTELEESGFSEIELVRIMKIVMQANSLDDDLLEQARQSFLAEQRQQQGK